MIPFEYLEHTADVKFRAYGQTAEEMLSNAASALFAAMVDPASVRVTDRWKVELEASSLDDLAYKWLSEIVFLFETESAVFSRFLVHLQQHQQDSQDQQDGPWRLQAEIGGERIDLQRHAFLTEVKAVTMHKFRVMKNDKWCIQVILDV